MQDEDFEAWDTIETSARRFREAADSALATRHHLDTHALADLIACVARDRAHHAAAAWCPVRIRPRGAP